MSGDTSSQRRADSTCRTAWPARMPPTGWASGGTPQSRRTCLNSSSTSSRRSCGAQHPQPRVQLGDQPHGQPVEGGAQRDAGRDRQRRHLRRDVFVDESRRLPDAVGIDAVLEPEPGERVAQHLAGHPVQRVGDRQHGRGDRLGAVAGGLDRHRQRVSAGALAVEADRQAGGLRQLVDDAVARARVERAGRVVHQHVVGAQLGQPSRLVDHPRQVRHEAGEGQAGVQAAARLAHGRGGRLEVLHVVQRVVQPEDLDAALGRAEDEAAHQVVGQRPRADQEPAAQRHLQRRRRGSAP